MRASYAAAALALLALSANSVSASDATEASAKCSVSGVGHVMTFDNEKEENAWAGVFTLSKSKDGFFDSAIRRRSFTHDTAEVVVVHDVAVQCGQDLLEFLVVGGEPSATTSPSIHINFNGARQTAAKGDIRKLVHFPDDQRHAGRPGLMQLQVREVSGTTFQAVVDCNKLSSVEQPGNFQVVVVYTIAGARVFGEVDVTADPVTYGDGNMAGICGWRSDAEDTAMQAYQCISKKFESEQCMQLIKRPDGAMLFRDNKGVEHGEKFSPIFDLTKLQGKRADCQSRFNKVAPANWLHELPADIQIRLSTFVDDCAVDAYFGLAHNMEAKVCLDVATRLTDLRARIAENFASVRCIFTYENSLHINGSVSYRIAMEEYMTRLDVDRHRLHALCGGPCHCPPSPLDPKSPNNLACKDLPASWADELLVRVGRKAPPQVSTQPTSASGVPLTGTTDTAPEMRFKEARVSLQPRDV